MKAIAIRATLAAALVAALVGGGVAAATPNPVVAASLRTARVGSATVSFRATFTANALSFTMRGRGVVSGQNARMSLRYPTWLVGPARDATADFIVRMERGRPIVYFRMGALRDELPPGKRWVRIDLAKQGRKLGLDFSKLMGGAGLGSWDMTGMLRYAGRTTRVGRERVLGETMTRYRVVVDLARAAKRDPQLAPSLRQLIRLTGQRRMSMGAWVDARGYLRRMRQVFSYFEQSSGFADIKMTIDYVSFGRPVYIAAPPAREVVDFSDLDS